MACALLAALTAPSSYSPTAATALRRSLLASYDRQQRPADITNVHSELALHHTSYLLDCDAIHAIHVERHTQWYTFDHERLCCRQRPWLVPTGRAGSVDHTELRLETCKFRIERLEPINQRVAAHD